KNKVWNDLYEAFSKAKPEVVEGSQWRKGGKADSKDLGVDGNPRLPVLRVTRREAEEFADWLGGQLPTADQLDRAAGLWAGGGRVGPARGPRVAVKLRGTGPRPVDDPKSDDISPLEIRDLAGNGQEWTSDNLDAGGVKMAILRGRSYTALTPLL